MTRPRRSLSLITLIACVLGVSPFVLEASAPLGPTVSTFYPSAHEPEIDLDSLGRWKLDGNGGCYWDANDSGSNQCNPNNPDGRYKITSSGCVWAANEFGADQCNPATYGRYKIDGNGGCTWVANDTGPNQCDPNNPDGRYKITSSGCVWAANEFGSDQCNPATYGRYKIDGNGGCAWVANDTGPNQCDPNNPDGRYKITSSGCVWAATEFGADQCNPATYGHYRLNGSGGCSWVANAPAPSECDPNNPDGRYKVTSDGCVWDATEFGADLCNPATYGHYKLNGNGGCSWVANAPAPSECDPNNPDGRYKIDSQGGCAWFENDFGPDQCNPADNGRYKVDGTGACYWEPNDVGPNQCHPSDPDGRYSLDGSGGCYWTPSVAGADECVPNLPPPDEPLPDDSSAHQDVDVCMANITNIALAKKGTMVDGVLHVTLEIDPALFGDMASPDSKASAIKKAAESWNEHTASTKVHWIPVPSGGDTEVDILETGQNGAGVAGEYGTWRGCGDAAVYPGVIFLTRDTVNRSGLAEIEIAARHELGHLYGSSNASSGIMKGLLPNQAHRDQGIHNEDCYDMLRDGPGHGRPSNTIQPSDVQFATSCVSQALGGRQFNGYEIRQLQKHIPPEMGGGVCMQSWYTQVTSSCSSINGQSLSCGVTGVYYLSLVSSDCPV